MFPISTTFASKLCSHTWSDSERGLSKACGVRGRGKLSLETEMNILENQDFYDGNMER